MGRQTPPNKPSKSPNKRIEEQDKQPNNDPSTNITPQPATARKNTTDTIKQSENPQTKPYRAHTPIQDIYASNESMLHHMDKIDRERKLKGQALYLDDDESLRTMEKSEHVNNTEDTMTNPKMGEESSPTQNDRKEAAQDSDASSPMLAPRP
jgi:hypothetical protein